MENNSINAVRLLTTLAVIAVCTPLILYFLIFAHPTELNLSANDDNWANFGSFIGGTVGSILSGLAFIGIYKTYQLQNLQLQQANNKRRSEDLQRLISATTDRIDTLLKSPVDLHHITFGRNVSDEIYDVETAIVFMRGVTAYNSDEFNMHISSVKDALDIDFKKIIIQVNSLSWLLEHQESIFGEDTLINYYRLRYRSLLVGMLNVGFSLHRVTLDVFDLEENKAAD